MTHPDPNAPGGQDAAFDETQLGAPRFGGAMQSPQPYPAQPPHPNQPHPAQPYPAQPRPAAPQAGRPYAAPPFAPQPAPGAPHARQAYPPAVHAPQTFPPHPGPPQPGPYGGGPSIPGPPYAPPYGQAYPPLPPRRRRTGLVVGAVIVAALVAVGVTLGVVRPWESDEHDGTTTESLALEHGVTLQVQVPAGWKARVDTLSGEKTMFVSPTTEHRSLTQIDADGGRMSDGGSGEDIHAVIGVVESCGTSAGAQAVGEWKKLSEDSRDQGAVYKADRMQASLKTTETYCLSMIAVDAASDGARPDKDALRVANRIVDDELITTGTVA